MAIYRGAGGSGASTTDSYLNQVTQQALDAGVSATSAASSLSGITTQAAEAARHAGLSEASATEAAASATAATVNGNAAGATAATALTAIAAAATAATDADVLEAEAAKAAAETAQAAVAAAAAAAVTVAAAIATSASNAATSASTAAGAATLAANNAVAIAAGTTYDPAALVNDLTRNTQATNFTTTLTRSTGVGDGVSEVVSEHTLSGTQRNYTKAQRSGIDVVVQDGTGAIVIPLDESNNFSVSIGLSGTIANPVDMNLYLGQTGSIFLTQPTAGGNTLSFGTQWKFAGGEIPVISATGNPVDRIDYIVYSSTAIHAVMTLVVS